MVTGPLPATGIGVAGELRKGCGGFCVEVRRAAEGCGRVAGRAAEGFVGEL